MLGRTVRFELSYHMKQRGEEPKKYELVMNWYMTDNIVIHLVRQTCCDLDAANISVRSSHYFMGAVTLVK